MHPKKKEKKILQQMLKLAPDQSTCLSYEELLGFLFGLAITPEPINPGEWFPAVFGDELPDFKAPNQMEKMFSTLIQVFNKMVTAHNDNALEFPFDFATLSDEDIEHVYAWVSGFDEALFLREELWDPEESTYLTDHGKEELYYSLLTIRGMVEPDEVKDFFANLPDEAFQEATPADVGEDIDKESQIQLMLIASLPLAVETLQQHSRVLHALRQKKMAPPENGSGEKRRKGNVIKVDFGQKGKKRRVVQTFQLKISLQGAKPPIWRRIQVPGSLDLARLHHVIQLAMGWQDAHLHQFLIDRTCYCQPEKEDTWRTSRPMDENKFTLQQLAPKLSPSFVYIYDFGDDWLHRITVEKVTEEGDIPVQPLLLAGRRACPPENVGGIPGYMEVLEILQDPEHERYKETKRWLGEDFDPARFQKSDIAAINAMLQSLS